MGPDVNFTNMLHGLQLAWGLGPLARAFDTLERELAIASGRPFDVAGDYVTLVERAADRIAAGPAGEVAPLPGSSVGVEFRGRPGGATPSELSRAVAGPVPGPGPLDRATEEPHGASVPPLVLQQLQEARARIEQVTSEHAVAQARLAALNERLGSREVELRQAQAKAARLEQEADRAQRDRDERLSAREAELREAKAKAARLEEEADRTQREREEFRRQGRGLVEGIIQARDQLERVGDDERVSAEQVVEYLLKHTAQVLERHGIVAIRDEGGPTNPNCQEALDFVATDDPARHMTIHSTVRTGYRQDGALIRPQQVLVWRLTEGNGSPDT